MLGDAVLCKAGFMAVAFGDSAGVIFRGAMAADVLFDKFSIHCEPPTRMLRNLAGAEPWVIRAVCEGWPLPQLTTPKGRQ